MQNDRCVECARSRRLPETRPADAAPLVDHRTSSARQRAAKNGVAFTLPEGYAEKLLAEATQCPACDAEMVDGGRHSRSLDRVLNEHGYEPGNVAIICWRCNTRKGDMTGAELQRLATWTIEAEKAALDALLTG